MNRELVRSIRTAVAERLAAPDPGTAGPLDLADEQVFARHLIAEALEAHARETLRQAAPPLSADDEAEIAQAVHDELFGLGRLQRLLDDPRVTDIHAQGYDQVFVVHDDGTKHRAEPIADSDTELVELIRIAAARLGRSERRFDAGTPELNLRLPDGSRLFAVMSVAARPSLAIRRHRLSNARLTDLVRLGALDEATAEFLAAAVRARKNIVVAGGTSMGKTTLLRALLHEVPPHERLVTVEDSAELGIDQFPELHPDVVTLEAREANVEGQGEISLERLVRMALRMDPDRVIVGEVRGDEVLPMLNAMSQGNDGSMCTIHAHSSAAVFRKLAMYAMQTPQRLPMEATNLLVATAVDLVVHLGRDHGPDRRGARHLTSIREVVDADGAVVTSNEVFAPGPGRRAVPSAPPTTDLLDDLVRAGFDESLLLSPAGWWR